MIRKEIIKKIKKLELKVLKWQDYNDVWNDLKYKYGTTEEEFQFEINLMMLVPLNQHSNHTDYRIIQTSKCRIYK